MLSAEKSQWRRENSQRIWSVRWQNLVKRQVTETSAVVKSSEQSDHSHQCFLFNDWSSEQYDSKSALIISQSLIRLCKAELLTESSKLV